MTTVHYFDHRAAQEIELDFVAWGKHSLVVRYPPGTRKAGEQWTIPQKRLHKLLGLGLVRVEGYRPGWAEEQS